MHAAVLQALEFTHIVDVLRGCAVTPLGAERLAGLKPLADPRKVAQLLAATSEGVRFNELVGGFALSAPADLAAILAGLAVEGRALEPLRLLGLAEYLESVDDDARRHSPDRARVPDPEGPGRERGVVPRGDRRDAPQDRAVGRGRRRRQPRAEGRCANASGASGRG